MQNLKNLCSVQDILEMPSRHSFYGCCLSPIISVYVKKCSLLWLSSVQHPQTLQMVALGLWKRCSLGLLCVFTWHRGKRAHGTAAPRHVRSVCHREMHSIFRHIQPIILGFVLFHWFFCMSSVIRGAEMTIRFFVVESISKYHHWCCLELNKIISCWDLESTSPPSPFKTFCGFVHGGFCC